MSESCYMCYFCEKKGKNYICNFKQCNMGSKPYYKHSIREEDKKAFFDKNIIVCNYIKKEVYKPKLEQEKEGIEKWL